MLAGIGSIPAEQLFKRELDTVGAIASKWVFLIPVPLHQVGSPYSCANALEVASAFCLKSENKVCVQAVEEIELNGKFFFWRN